MRQKAYEEYAKAIGSPPLSDHEKQMAIINYILEDKMKKEKGKATFKITYDLIAQALCLPDGTEITRIISTPDSSIFCTFVVKHADFPPDDHIFVKPKFRRVSQSVIEFDGWGIIEAE